MSRWYLYMVRCRDDSLYTGITTDVPRRIEEHRRNDGRSARYLRGRGPLQLVLRRRIGPRGLALLLEDRIKRLSKTRKEELIGRAGRLEGLLRQVRNHRRP